MAKFTTRSGTYKVKITIPVIKAIKEDLGYDIGDVEQLFELANDVVTFVDALYLACKKHLPKGMDDVQFGESLAGDDLEKAWKAFERAYLDFCPSHKREAVRLLVAKTHQIAEKARAEVCSRLATSLGESSE